MPNLSTALVAFAGLSFGFVPVGTTPQFATLNGQVLQIVQLPQSEASQLSSDNDLQLQLFANGHKVYQLVPASNISKTELCSVLAINPASELDLTNQNKQGKSSPSSHIVLLLRTASRIILSPLRFLHTSTCRWKQFPDLSIRNLGGWIKSFI